MTGLGYAERLTNFTTTNTSIISTTAGLIPNMSVTFVGEGSEAEITFATPVVGHSALPPGIVTTTLVQEVGGVRTAVMPRNWVTGYGEGGVLLYEAVFDAGVEYTFSVTVGSTAAGTSTVYAKSGGGSYPLAGKIYLSANRC